MNPKIKKFFIIIFDVVHYPLKPAWVQRLLRTIGFRFPYLHFAEKLNYQGVVDFSINGQEIKLQSHNNFIEIYIFWYGIFGVWEPTQLRLWSQLIKEADVILDVGANIGVYTLIAATNKEAEVLAFEPVPKVREMLEENITLNDFGNIIVSGKLVGEKIGQETLYIPRSGWVDVASVNKEFSRKFSKPDEATELVCEMVTIDEVVASHNLNVNTKILCKIDVEGAEDRVFVGMQETMKKYNISFTAELLDEETFSNFIKLLSDTYYVYAIDEREKRVYQSQHFVNTASNYFFTKQKSDYLNL